MRIGLAVLVLGALACGSRPAGGGGSGGTGAAGGGGGGGGGGAVQCPWDTPAEATTVCRTACSRGAACGGDDPSCVSDCVGQWRELQDCARCLGDHPCDQVTCGVVCTPCETDGDCSDGKACSQGGFCVKRECTTDAECPCKGSCQGPLCNPPQCLEDTDCERFEFCTPDHYCVIKPCQQGSECRTGLCVQAINETECDAAMCCGQVPCRTDSDCSKVETCNLDAPGGYCGPIECTQDADCPTGTVCGLSKTCKE